MMVEVFNNEQKVLLNGICKGEKMSAMKREDVMESLLFSKQIVEDAMMADLVDSTFSAVKAMSDKEWDEVKMYAPFEVAVDPYEEDVAEVPVDEDIL